jgi:hypothetical protein
MTTVINQWADPGVEASREAVLTATLRAGGTNDTERAWAARGNPLDGTLAIVHARLIDALLFDEEMAEDAFMADPTSGNYNNMLWARSRVENMNGLCQRKCCQHSGELHEFTCLVGGCACQEYAPGDVRPGGDRAGSITPDDHGPLASPPGLD